MKNQKDYYLKDKVIEELFRQIVERNLTVIPKQELIENVKDKRVVNFLKGKNEGIETCYHGFFNGSEIIVCTTHSDYLRGLKKHDLGWVLLLNQNSDEPFFSFPIKRTKNYCETMLAWLDCILEIAQKWPTLPGTDIPLRLVREKSLMHMRRFIPPKNSGRHPYRKPFYFWIVEMDLSEKNSKFLISKFKRYYDWRTKDGKKREENGQPPRAVARVIRHDQKHGLNQKPKGQHSVRNEYTDPEPDYNFPDN